MSRMSYILSILAGEKKMKAGQKRAILSKLCLILVVGLVYSQVPIGAIDDFTETSRDTDGNITIIGGFNPSKNLVLVEFNGNTLREFDVDRKPFLIIWTGKDFLIILNQREKYVTGGSDLLRYSKDSLETVDMGKFISYYHAPTYDFQNIKCNNEFCLLYFLVGGSGDPGGVLAKYSDGIFEFPILNQYELVQNYDWDGSLWILETDRGIFYYDGEKLDRPFIKGNRLFLIQDFITNYMIPVFLSSLLIGSSILIIKRTKKAQGFIFGLLIYPILILIKRLSLNILGFKVLGEIIEKSITFFVPARFIITQSLGDKIATSWHLWLSLLILLLNGVFWEGVLRIYQKIQGRKIR